MDSLKYRISKMIAYAIYLFVPKAVLQHRDFFKMWEKKGIHITPVHYYQPIPDTRHLDDKIWSKPSDLIGINMNEEAQKNLLSKFSSKYKKEYDKFPKTKTDVPHQYYHSMGVGSGSYKPIDSEVLYSMVRYFKPSRIIEVGSGSSTCISAQAIIANRNESRNNDCELITIEPFPSEIIKEGFPGLSKLIPKRVQDVPFTEFEQLGGNDILFIDSTHVLNIGSDVKYEILEILPRLKKGVIIHFHDIYLPLEYPKENVLGGNYTFWTEQYLLQAFLSFNISFEVIWAGIYMHYTNPEILEKAFSNYKLCLSRSRERPGFASFWIRKIE